MKTSLGKVNYMKIIIRWFCLCMLLLFFVFSVSDIQTSSKHELSVKDTQVSDTDSKKPSPQHQMRAKMVSKTDH